MEVKGQEGLLGICGCVGLGEGVPKSRSLPTQKWIAATSAALRAVENSAVDLLDRLAAALSADFSDFFRSPRSGEVVPKGGRKRSAKGRRG